MKNKMKKKKWVGLFITQYEWIVIDKYVLGVFSTMFFARRGELSTGFVYDLNMCICGK